MAAHADHKHGVEGAVSGQNDAVFAWDTELTAAMTPEVLHTPTPLILPPLLYTSKEVYFVCHAPACKWEIHARGQQNEH